MTDYSELKRLAEAATPGPWYQHGGIMQVLNHDCETVCETFEDDGDCPDAQFIAAANPTAVLALIAENERLVGACERAEQIIIVECKEASFAKARANLLETERDQLKAENEALVSALNDILRVTPMGVEAFGIAALVLGELSASAMSKGEQS